VGAQRAAVVLTCLVVSGLGCWLLAAQWGQANRVATIASALGTVAAVGVGVWAAVRKSEPSRVSVRVVRTGRAEAGRGGTAVAGVRISGAPTPRSVRAYRTGQAEAGDGGEAVTGVYED
jgi:hypothetical protein